MSTYSRVTLTHTPTGFVFEANCERSQARQRVACYSMLRGKLWCLERATEKPPATEAQKAIADRILARALHTR